MEKIKSVVLLSMDDYIMVQKAIKDKVMEKGFKLKRLPIDINIDNYYFVKSHRSSVTEGNTTSIGEFTNIVVEHNKNNHNYVVPNKSYDETFEIINLKKVYEYLNIIDNYSIKVLQRSHSILGEKIFRNNLIEYRGKLKTISNYVPFNYKGKKYSKFFIDPHQVKEKIINLFNCLSKLEQNDESLLFANYIIMQLELISIHPFNDGNGRVSRALSESYLEKGGYLPYIPYSTSHKKLYQETMAEYSILSLTSIVKAYCYFAEFIIDSYQANTSDLLNSLENK